MTTYSWKTEYLKDRKKWRIRIELGEDANGKRKYQTKTLKATSKREALEEGRKYYNKFLDGEFINADLTFENFIEEWHEKYALRHLSPTTLQNHNIMLRKHILPIFGYRKIKEINVRQGIDFIQKLEEKGLAPSSIKRIKNILNSIFNVALKWEIIQKNPIKDVTVPKSRKEDIEIFSEEEIQVLLQVLEKEPPRSKVLIKLALSTGMRKGELLGLQWEDINFEEGIIKVANSLKYINGVGYMLGTTKTKKTRIITIDNSTVHMLKDYRRTKLKEKLIIGDKWKDSDYNFIFTTMYGTPIFLDSPNRIFKKILQRNNLKITKFHALRHTHATFLLLKGINVKVIQERLGHSNINMTLDTYTHVLKEMDKEAVEHFDVLFKQA